MNPELIARLIWNVASLAALVWSLAFLVTQPDRISSGDREEDPP